MRNRGWWVFVLSVGFLLWSTLGTARETAPEAVTTKGLIEHFFPDEPGLFSKGRSHEYRRALAWLIIDRARRTGEWKLLLKRARKGCWASIGMLGKMLAREDKERRAVARFAEAMKTATDVPPGKRDPQQHSDIRAEVVPVLRSLVLPRPGRDNLLLALVRSRDPGLDDYYLPILTERGSPGASRFYAAAGLARLGNEKGRTWLAANVKKGGELRSAPDGAESKTIGAGCRRLLEDLDAPFVETVTWRP